MALLTVLPLVLAFQKDRTQTLGLTYSQILRMGESRWEDLVLKKQGDSTVATAGGLSTYGDALASRNDRLLKGRKLPLRGHLRDFSNEVQTVGYSRTEGGTMWQITAGQYYKDVEATVYRVLTHSGHAPKRVVSDVEKALAALQRVADGTQDSKYRAEAKKAMANARTDLRLIVTDARTLSRHDSDTVLEFCRSAALGIEDQAKDL